MLGLLISMMVMRCAMSIENDERRPGLSSAQVILIIEYDNSSIEQATVIVL